MNEVRSRDPNRDSETNDQEAFVRDLYLGVLKRPGEDAGIIGHAQSLGAKPSFRDAKNLLRTVIESAENASIVVSRAPKINLTAFDHVISIGFHCITSSSLKELGLKQWSGPFDWIFSTIEMATHCIRDDFETFLDRRFHQKVPDDQKVFINENKCEHLYYKENFGVRFIFNHYDITEDEYFFYYQRCVERFRQAIFGPESGRSLLVSIGYNIANSSFDDLCDAVKTHASVRVLCVRTVGNCALDDIGIRRVADINGNRLYEMRLVGELGAVNFTEQLDQLMFAKLISEIV